MKDLQATVEALVERKDVDGILILIADVFADGYTKGQEAGPPTEIHPTVTKRNEEES